MKKRSTYRGLNLFLAAFFLVGGLLFATNSAQAQSVGQTLIVSGYNWLPQQDAMNALKGQVAGIRNQVHNGSLVYGTPQWQNAMRYAIFYKDVYANLRKGDLVPDALLHTFQKLSNANTLGSTNNSVAFTPQQAYTIAEEVKEMLSL